ncbi:MAG: hypothetical protein PHV18_16550 [Lachnospiraceae bacterium]|nr:hypothetical protein [Lachnospiraceae bacterium]
MRSQKLMKRLLITGMVSAMTAAYAFPALAAGWTTVGDKHYYYYDNGQMATGLINVGGKYYYMLDDGSMVIGWLKLDSDYYYMGADGALTTGSLKLGNDSYYMRPDSGKCVLDEAVEIDGAWYFFKSDGKKLTGWLLKEGQYFYLDPAADGRLVAGTTKTIDGVSYSFAANGACTTNVSVNNAYIPSNKAAENAAQETTPSTDDSYGRTNVITAGQH